MCFLDGQREKILSKITSLKDSNQRKKNQANCREETQTYATEG